MSCPGGKKSKNEFLGWWGALGDGGMGWSTSLGEEMGQGLLGCGALRFWVWDVKTPKVLGVRCSKGRHTPKVLYVDTVQRLCV